MSDLIALVAGVAGLTIAATANLAAYAAEAHVTVAGLTVCMAMISYLLWTRPERSAAEE